MAIGDYVTKSIEHVLDDDETNVLAEGALLRVGEKGNIKVMLDDLSVVVLHNYENVPLLVVKKVFRDQLTIPEIHISLLQ